MQFRKNYWFITGTLFGICSVGIAVYYFIFNYPGELENILQLTVTFSNEKPKPKKIENISLSLPTETDTHHSITVIKKRQNLTEGHGKSMISAIIEAPPGAEIEITRTRDFQSIYMRNKIDMSGKFNFINQPPGVFYWRVKGTEQVYTIHIRLPERLNLEFNSANSLTLKDTLTWKKNKNVAFYKIEYTKDKNFKKDIKRINTTATKIFIRSLGVGKYYLRLSALNMQNGVWEASAIKVLNVSH